MSTFALSPESVIFIGQAAMSLGLNTHKSSAWNDSGASGRLFRATWDNWIDKDAPFPAELVSRAMDTLSLFNQRAVSVRYAHNGEFQRAIRIKNIPACTSDLLSHAEYVRAYKYLQCLNYNLDQYASNDNVKAIVQALNDLFIAQIIHESAAYKSASWG